MTEPLKVTLPPWRRGDGKPCKEPGWYACRPYGDMQVRELFTVCRGDLLSSAHFYAGPLPIELIETEPEPELIVLDGHHVTIIESQHGNHHRIRMCPKVDMACEVALEICHKDKRIAIEKFNAAVRAMEGKT